MELRVGYKQTEMGAIPEDWGVLPLSELSEFITSGSRGWAAYYADRGALFVRSQNVRDGRLDFADRQFVNAPVGAEGNRTRLKLSDLLITITGNSVGNVALVDEELGEAYISQHVGLVRLSDPLQGSFICRFLAPGSAGNEQIFASQSGQSKPGLSLRNLQEFLVTLPPVVEQRAIATALSDVDALLAKIDQLIAKKRDLKQAAMQKLLTGQTRLPGFCGEWEITRLRDVATANKGIQLPSSESTGDFAHLNGGVVPSSYTASANAPGESIAISEGGNSCGFVQFMKDPYWCGGHCYSVLPRGVENAYLYHALKGRQSEIMALRVGSGLPNIQKSALLNFVVSIPTEKLEQTAIARILSDMDAELAALEVRRNKTRALKQGMMQALLTGRIRLPTGRIRLPEKQINVGRNMA